MNFPNCHSTAGRRLCTLAAFATLLALGLAFALPREGARGQVVLPTATPTPDPFPAVGPFTGTLAPASTDYVPGELLVTMRAGFSAAASSANSVAATASLDVQVLASFDASGPDDNLMTYKLSTPPGREYDVAALLSGQPGVVAVEPNWYVYAAQEEPTIPADADPVSTATVDSGVARGFPVNDSLYAARQWNMQRINAARAWQLLDAQGQLESPEQAIVVAVIDSGIEITHTDFSGRLLPGFNYVGLTYSDPPTNSLPVQQPMVDECGHGTHVAGIIAASLNDEAGVAGVAPFASIAPYRVFNSTCSGSVDTLATAIIQATDDGADIINLSVQYGFFSTPVYSATLYAESKGVLMIAAAGNNGGAVQYPARHPQVMAVAALNILDEPTWFSQSGPEVEIAAPGGDADFSTRVLSSWPSNPAAKNRCNNGNGGVITETLPSGETFYCALRGTSQASPAVAGVAALLMASNPALDASAARTILRNTAAPLDADPESVGAGKLDALAALRSQLPSDLTLSPVELVREMTTGSDPEIITVRLDNPSLDAIDWTAGLSTTVKASAEITGFAVISLTTGSGGTQAGSTLYGEPFFFSLLISPKDAGPGRYTGGLILDGTRSDGSKLTRTFPIRLIVRAESLPPKVYLNEVHFSPVGRTIESYATPFSWLEPVTVGDRLIHPLTDTASVELGSPFTISFGGASYDTLRVHSDGFLTLPAALPVFPSPAFTPTVNSCLPAVAYPEQAVFGWWADLDPGATGAQVSSFPLAGERLVVEFADVPMLTSSTPATVSFQIVLNARGDVLLNYAHAPTFAGSPAPVTVGAEVRDSLFYSLIACSRPGRVEGVLPRSGESFLIRPVDIY